MRSMPSPATAAGQSSARPSVTVSEAVREEVEPGDCGAALVGRALAASSEPELALRGAEAYVPRLAAVP
ncbi:hypothetical protein ABZS83_31900, partial [Streptomyces sp. NPDC005426]|uniref:hypothetical protein n=1 Tax=Streptomyces sp. NPDC005426 TaxID=3155344 RepID=UPI0033AC7D3D